MDMNRENDCIIVPAMTADSRKFYVDLRMRLKNELLKKAKHIIKSERDNHSIPTSSLQTNFFQKFIHLLASPYSEINCGGADLRKVGVRIRKCGNLSKKPEKPFLDITTRNQQLRQSESAALLKTAYQKCCTGRYCFALMRTIDLQTKTLFYEWSGLTRPFLAE